ncbi:hypothetical protein RJ640_010865 [Escallonia rubra]|uniref:UDENN domain-containing protein n=1 Tax=Escallonia rubra TaxID=112253 RepID=A0AA88RX27_9ASTE|nr:hypothetical protein RJ640_010865 [Escallonia rubra]
MSRSKRLGLSCPDLYGSVPGSIAEGDGSKIYVSCIAFRDPVCEDIAEAYRIPANSFADKCICLVSRSPSFHILREALEELFALCFSPRGCSKPLWDVIAHMVSNIPLPTPGKDRVLFAIENSLLAAEVPPKDGLPHADISFQPLMQCLDVDNFIKVFTAVLIERRILLRSNKTVGRTSSLKPFILLLLIKAKYSLLTLASEAICHLIYPFRWQHVYIPLLFFSGVDYIDAPTPYMMGLHSGVDTSDLTMDGSWLCANLAMNPELHSITEYGSAWAHHTHQQDCPKLCILLAVNRYLNEI